METAKTFLAQFRKEYREGQAQYSANCPAHPDSTASLSILIKPDRAVLKCHHRPHGCEVGDILAAVGMGKSDLIFGNGTRKKVPLKLVAAYPYQDTQGRELFQVCRFEPKTFRQRRRTKTGFVWNLKGVNPVLYRLPELLAAVKEGWPIYIAEGEKDIDNLRDLGLAATTNPGGVGMGWKNHYSEALLGADVVILPDQDEPGRLHGEAVALALIGKAKSVRVLDLPGPGKDVSDWIEQGGDREQLEDLAEACPEWKPDAGAIKEVEEAARINSYEPADVGNAELYAALYGGVLRFVHPRKQWLVWQGHHWGEDIDGEHIRLASETWKARHRAAEKEADRKRYDLLVGNAKSLRKKYSIDQMLGLARSFKPIADSGAGWDSDPMLYGVGNGAVDLITGELRPGRPEDKISRWVDLPYDPHASEPKRFIRLIDEYFSDYAELPRYIQKCIGYSLTGSTQAECLFFLYGPGGNGKSTLLETLLGITGGYGDGIKFDTLRQVENSRKTGSDASPDVARLAGFRLVKVSEIKAGEQFDAGRLKEMVSGDRITARFLYGQEFSFNPTAKFWLMGNTKPKGENTAAFWRRMRLINLEKQFSPDQEPDLKATLKVEAAAILRWAVEGALLWQTEGLEPPDCVKQWTQEYRDKSDPWLNWVSARLIEDRDFETKAQAAWQSYASWCGGKEVKDILEEQQFYKRMEGRFGKSIRHGDARCYQGIRLRQGAGSRPVGRVGLKSLSSASEGTVVRLAGRKKPTPPLKVVGGP